MTCRVATDLVPFRHVDTRWPSPSIIQMCDPAQLRDSTQIVLERDVLAGLDANLTDRFAVTIAPVDEEHCKVTSSLP